VKRNGTWETRQREAEKTAQQHTLRAELRRELRHEVRRELTAEFIQFGLVRITDVDHVNALIAGRNLWRGARLLDELEKDFAAAGNAEAAAAIRDYRRIANELSSRKRPDFKANKERQQEPETRALLPPAEAKLAP
jgi:hypothetical protein